MNIICFHNPNEENGYLSNWYISEFTVDGVLFSSVEQYMMYCKAISFNDIETANAIMNTDDVACIKSLGRSVKGYNDSYWNGVRQLIVYKGLLAKFTDNQILRNKLLSTDNAILAECAVKDLIWGIGLSMDNPDRFDINKWKGQNLLGYSLMMVRREFANSVNSF